jgi:hypothetical protein
MPSSAALAAKLCLRRRWGYWYFRYRRGTTIVAFVNISSSRTNETYLHCIPPTALHFGVHLRDKWISHYYAKLTKLNKVMAVLVYIPLLSPMCHELARFSPDQESLPRSSHRRVSRTANNRPGLDHTEQELGQDPRAVSRLKVAIALRSWSEG